MPGRSTSTFPPSVRSRCSCSCNPAIRAWIETDPAARTGWLGALRDRQIGRALALVHRDPSRDWTLAGLAAESAMSRSAFAARFTELVGEPAMKYATRWRMHAALNLLTAVGVTVADVAGRLGYRSEAAFSRAFTRVVGVTPGPPAVGVSPAWPSPNGRLDRTADRRRAR